MKKYNSPLAQLFFVVLVTSFGIFAGWSINQASDLAVSEIRSQHLLAAVPFARTSAKIINKGDMFIPSQKVIDAYNEALEKMKPKLKQYTLGEDIRKTSKINEGLISDRMGIDKLQKTDLPNQAPVAVDDNVSVLNAGQLSMIVWELGENDYDPDGDAFGVVSIDSMTLELPGSPIVDVFPNMFSTFSGNGLFSVFLFDPTSLNLDACDRANLTITYTIADEHGLTDTATGYITIGPNDEMNLIVGENASDVSGSLVPHHISGLYNHGPIYGSDCEADVLVGDYGFEPIDFSDETGDYNFQLIIDRTGSMGWSSVVLENIMEPFFSSISEYYEQGFGNIAVNLILFQGDSLGQVSVNFAEDGMESVDILNSLLQTMPYGSSTNFEVPLTAAAEWLSSGEPISGAFTRSIFIGDGNMNLILNEEGVSVPGEDIGEITGATDGSNEVAILQSLTDEVISVALTDGTEVSYETLDVISDSGIAEYIDPAGFVYFIIENTLPVQGLGGDVIYGYSGDDIIFADMVNTDQLAQEQDLYEYPGQGWAIFEALEDGLGLDSDWSRADTLAYLRNNHNLDTKIAGSASFGRDVINSGPGDDTVFGQHSYAEIRTGDGDDFVAVNDPRFWVFPGSGDNTVDINHSEIITHASVISLSEESMGQDTINYHFLGEPSGNVQDHNQAIIGNFFLSEDTLVFHNVDDPSLIEVIDSSAYRTFRYNSGYVRIKKAFGDGEFITIGDIEFPDAQDSDTPVEEIE